jgi:hypothetical protein
VALTKIVAFMSPLIGVAPALPAWNFFRTDWSDLRAFRRSFSAASDGLTVFAGGDSPAMASSRECGTV